MVQSSHVGGLTGNSSHLASPRRIRPLHASAGVVLVHEGASQYAVEMNDGCR